MTWTAFAILAMFYLGGDDYLINLVGQLTIQDEAGFCNIVCYLGGDDYLIFRTRQASATTSAFSLICPSSVTLLSWFEISHIDIDDVDVDFDVD